MAYEEVNVNKLKNSLNSLDDITSSKNKLKKVANSLNSSGWSGNSRVRIKNALDDMNFIYEQIEEYVKKCKMAANYMEQYKELDNQNKQYQNKVSSGNSQIRNAAEDIDTSNIENKVESYKKSIANNNSKK